MAKVKCITDKFIQYEWVWTESIQQSIWNKNQTHLYCMSPMSLLWLICFIFALNSSIVRHLKKWLSTWNQTTKSCKMTHWYCISLHVSDLINFICTLNSPILGDLYRNGYQPETKQQNVAYLQIHTKLTWSSLEKKWNAVQISVMAVWVSVNSKYSTNVKKNHSFVLYETHLVLWLKFASLIYPDLTHPYLGIEMVINLNTEIVINLKLRHEKLNNVDQSNVKSQMQIHMSLCKIMNTDESQ